jgi:hypothetical protein
MSLYGGYVNIAYNDTYPGSSTLPSRRLGLRPPFRRGASLRRPLPGNSAVGPESFTGRLPHAVQPVPQLDIGLDVVYGLSHRIQGPGTYAASASRPAVTSFDNKASGRR